MKYCHFDTCLNRFLECRNQRGIISIICLLACIILNPLFASASEKLNVNQLESELTKSKRTIQDLARKVYILENQRVRNSKGTNRFENQKTLQNISRELKNIEHMLSKIEKLDSSSTNVEDDESIESANKRLQTIEDSLLDVQEIIGSRAVVNAFDSIKLDIGGFLHSAYTYIDAEDDSAGSFNRQNFELLISAELNKQWSAFYAGGFLRESDDPFLTGSTTQPTFNSRNKNPLIIGWVNFSKSDAFNVRIGRFITPHGITNIEHFPATLLDPEQPQFLRPFSGDTLFPNFSTGVQLHGSSYLGAEKKLQYYIYVSNYAGNPENNRTGGMLEYEVTEDVTFGVNYSQGERTSGISYQLSGAHAYIEVGDLMWKTEYYTSSEDTPEDTDRSGGYTQPSFDLSLEWTLFYRYDVLDNGVRETQENVIGLNYVPYPNVRLRVNYTQKVFKEYLDVTNTLWPENDADIFQLSGTFSF